jgi:hypothetical protein
MKNPESTQMLAGVVQEGHAVAIWITSSPLAASSDDGAVECRRARRRASRPTFPGSGSVQLSVAVQLVGLHCGQVSRSFVPNVRVPANDPTAPSISPATSRGRARVRNLDSTVTK